MHTQREGRVLCAQTKGGKSVECGGRDVCTHKVHTGGKSEHCEWRCGVGVVCTHKVHT